MATAGTPRAQDAYRALTDAWGAASPLGKPSVTDMAEARVAMGDTDGALELADYRMPSGPDGEMRHPSKASVLEAVAAAEARAGRIGDALRAEAAMDIAADGRDPDARSRVDHVVASAMIRVGDPASALLVADRMGAGAERCRTLTELAALPYKD